MQLSCDCLNIFIHSKNANFMDLESYFTELFTEDPFFIEDVGLLSVSSVSVQIPSLVKERKSGEWRIVKCHNCDKSCYAISENLGFASLISRRDLVVDTNQINRLKQSDMYSPIFKIIIYRRDYLTDDEGGVDQKTTLYPTATSWLDEQTALTEERVKLFSEREYAALDELRQRAYREQRLINKREKECAKEKASQNDPVEDLSQQLKKQSLTDNKQKRFVSKSSLEEPLDTEGVFLLDGFESGRAEDEESLPETSDSDDSEGSPASQPRRTVTAAQLAKSLPIPVPQFMDDKNMNDPLVGSPGVPDDIAASIKALAKSVHGDAIFGELPRPRFSTHL